LDLRKWQLDNRCYIKTGTAHLTFLKKYGIILKKGKFATPHFPNEEILTRGQ